VSDFGVGYDYNSVMHYSRKAFSKNGEDTLTPLVSCFVFNLQIVSAAQNIFISFCFAERGS
jgi:Astacin (Peptidase family M12A)